MSPVSVAGNQHRTPAGDANPATVQCTTVVSEDVVHDGSAAVVQEDGAIVHIVVFKDIVINAGIPAVNFNASMPIGTGEGESLE